MELIILEAICEMTGTAFSSLEEAEKQYSKREIFEKWLEYEGILGYTDKIINILIALNIATGIDAEYSF